MQPFIAAMLRIRKAFYAALVRSLLRTKSLLQTILRFWISPSLIKEDNVNGDVTSGGKIGVQEFIDHVEKAFRASIGRKKLVELSNGLRRQFWESMEDNPSCMLPSFNHQLPSGDENGTFLALDVGGSTFRVALVQLLGRGGEGQESMVLKQNSFKITPEVKGLRGLLFFDWMAERIEETLSGQTEGRDMIDTPLSMGLAWSFPIEYIFPPPLLRPHDSQLTINQTNLPSKWSPSTHGERVSCCPRSLG
jgi:hexokinase